MNTKHIILLRLLFCSAVLCSSESLAHKTAPADDELFLTRLEQAFTALANGEHNGEARLITEFVSLRNKELLDKQLPISQKTPIQLAKEDDRPEVVTALLNVLYDAQKTLTSLEDALASDDSKTACAIIQKTPAVVLDEPLPKKKKPVIFFVLEKHQNDVAKALIEKKINLMVKSSTRETTLSAAVIEGASPEIFEELVKAAPDLAKAHGDFYDIVPVLKRIFANNMQRPCEDAQTDEARNRHLHVFQCFEALSQHGLLPSIDKTFDNNVRIERLLRADFSKYHTDLQAKTLVSASTAAADDQEEIFV